VFIHIETAIVRVAIVKRSCFKNPRRRITPNDENLTSGVDRHLVRECVKGA
jgi:hypothetical protein